MKLSIRQSRLKKTKTKADRCHQPTGVILRTEFVVEATKRSIRRHCYFIGQKFNFLGTVQTAYKITM